MVVNAFVYFLLILLFLISIKYVKNVNNSSFGRGNNHQTQLHLLHPTHRIGIDMRFGRGHRPTRLNGHRSRYQVVPQIAQASQGPRNRINQVPILREQIQVVPHLPLQNELLHHRLLPNRDQVVPRLVVNQEQVVPQIEMPTIPAHVFIGEMDIEGENGLAELNEIGNQVVPQIVPNDLQAHIVPQLSLIKLADEQGGNGIIMLNRDAIVPDDKSNDNSYENSWEHFLKK
ncbi:hypothetical protein ACQ4LE_001233 [Meloidogyne hapla]